MTILNWKYTGHLLHNTKFLYFIKAKVALNANTCVVQVPIIFKKLNNLKGAVTSANQSNKSETKKTKKMVSGKSSRPGLI